jgi:hypothetical protein
MDVDYKWIKDQAEKAYDSICVLIFETHMKDEECGELISKACSAIAELYRYAKKIEERDE